MEIEAMEAVFMEDFQCTFFYSYLQIVISTDPGTYKIKLVPVLGGENFGICGFLRIII